MSVMLCQLPIADVVANSEFIRYKGIFFMENCFVIKDVIKMIVNDTIKTKSLVGICLNGFKSLIYCTINVVAVIVPANVPNVA
jgi:hypothetical protein